LGGAYEDLLDFGEGAAIEVDVFAQAGAPGVDHGTKGVDDELGTGEVRRCRRQVHRCDLEQHEDVIA